MSIAKSMKVGGKKVELAYVTPEEKELLLTRDRAKGSITEKFHKGIPVLLYGPDDPGGSGRHVSDFGSAGSGGDPYGGGGELTTSGGSWGWEGGKEGGAVWSPDPMPKSVPTPTPAPPDTSARDAAAARSAAMAKDKAARDAKIARDAAAARSKAMAEDAARRAAAERAAAAATAASRAEATTRREVHPPSTPAKKAAPTWSEPGGSTAPSYYAEPEPDYHITADPKGSTAGYISSVLGYKDKIVRDEEKRKAEEKAESETKTKTKTKTEYPTEPGADAGGGKGTDYVPIDDVDPTAKVTNSSDCAAAGGIWDEATGVCLVKTDPKTSGIPSGGLPGDTGDGSGYDTDVGRGEPLDKAPPYGYKESVVRPGPGISETERVRAKVDAGTPFSVSIRDHLFGEASGIGSKYERLAEMDEDREFREKQLAQAQSFASKGMSFSTAQLDAETDMIREAAKRRLITADQADKLQYELQMNALRTAEPIELLAAAGKIGDAGYGGTFKPGAIDTSRFMDPERFGLARPPGFSGEPEEVGDSAGGEKEKPLDGTPGTGTHHTDHKGNTCYTSDAYETSDGKWVCPEGKLTGGGEK